MCTDLPYPFEAQEIPLSDSSGILQRYPDFKSQYIQARHVDVWCPPGYADQGKALYPVIYMHDGQNLFDAATCDFGIDWGVDETITRLADANQIPEVIVVGVWSTVMRYREYMPQKPLETGQAETLLAQFVRDKGGPPIADDYLKFLVEELKPFIDAHYRTQPDPGHTFVMGSSMGGLVSSYALDEYPHVFGKAGCLSTNWPIGGELLVDYLGDHLPEPAVHRLYFDYGTLGLDANYEPYQQRMDGHLQTAGYTPGKDWLTRKFDGADHNEYAWRERLDIPLKFLLAE